jgi:hypothetical protein
MMIYEHPTSGYLAVLSYPPHATFFPDLLVHHPFSNICRACRRPLGFEYAVVPFATRVLESVPPQRYLAKELGQVVRAIRLQNGLTRNQLAAATGKHVSFFSRLERGVIVP